MTRDTRVAAILALIASACASAPHIGDEAPSFTCGTKTSGWIISAAPENAASYRQLATKHPAFRSKKIAPEEWGQHDVETWLTKPSGEVLLCLSDGPPWESWGTSFWAFSAPDVMTGEFAVADQGATIIVG